MNKNLQFYAILFIMPFAAFLFMAQSGGAALNVTGSPLDIAAFGGGGPKDCTGCHSNTGNFSASLDITTDIAAGGYTLGQTYNITITQTSTGASKYGFEITAESTSSKVGVFASQNTSTQNPSSNTDFATHTTSGTNQQTWTVSWTAPSTDVGAITFYASSNAADGDGGVNGDQIVFSTEVIGSVLGINDARLLQFSMFPNPSDGQVTLQLPTGVNQAKVSVFDYLGKSLLQKNISASNNTIDISNLSAGLYFVRIQTDSKIGTKKLIVR